MMYWILCWRKCDEWLSSSDLCDRLGINDHNPANVQYSRVLSGLHGLVHSGLFERTKVKRRLKNHRYGIERDVYVYRPRKWVYDAIPARYRQLAEEVGALKKRTAELETKLESQ